MASNQIERNILTILEPAIVLDELSIPDVESGTENSNGLTIKERPSKFSQMIPEIRINGYDVQGDRLEFFRLRNTEFYPTCRMIFSDVDGFFLARHFPKDGDLIQVHIRSQGDETTFKPIRIDFLVTFISPAGGGGNVSANKFIVEGRMNVPNLFTEQAAFYEDTSWNTLLTIAEELQLGYASNVEDTADNMVWINPNDTVEKFLQDTIANSYLTDETFFTAYIDPYYYLTLVDVNRLFSQEGDIEVSQAFAQNAGDTMGAEGSSGQTDEFPNYLSNMLQMQGSARYISFYQMVSESGLVSKDNGYKRYSQHWDLEAREFISEFVDPLTDNTPGMIPVTKGRIINGQPEGPRDNQNRFKYLGTSGDNVHDEYMYSVILNYQNLVEVTKMGMVIELDTINPALVRYSRIYCQILEFAQPIKEVLLNPSTTDQQLGQNEQQRTTPKELDDTSSENGIVNEFLSGFYVINGLEYILTTPGGIRMKLYLQRREFTPST
jgi:hypothetical protein